MGINNIDIYPTLVLLLFDSCLELEFQLENVIPDPV